MMSFLRAGAAALAITAMAGLPAAQADTTAVPLIESGSSLLYPLFNIWVAAYGATHPGADITTTSTGSGAGIAQAIKGLVNIGASDAYMSDAMMKKNPGMLNIPLAISSQAVNYNLPGVTGLKLSGPILAGIYSGKITKWNDPAIAQANPGVSLPDHVIIPIHRLDGSGDTFIFTQYLSESDPQWGSTIKYGTAVSWPAVSGALGAKGNSGMLAAAKANPYSIAYIGISFASQAAEAGLGQAALLNKAGNYLLPTPETIGAAAQSVADHTPPDERISMIFADGPQSYPIVNYEYAIVNSHQPAAAIAAAVRDFLTWAITEGNSPQYLNKVHFLPLPSAVVELSKAQIAKIQ
ncbi:phosphate ABC transporter substrate-binding protein PstS [Acidocella sp.]|uniref:phosphate ABC transporter substrate-binding protein PstS n=1 Tax=Acidocella sp. TaxID=50710 RepID=UPI002621C834|nr:phosphate ABC transporter substrate-binding protein PstS [Acidocella sp.]